MRLTSGRKARETGRAGRSGQSTRSRSPRTSICRNIGTKPRPAVVPIVRRSPCSACRRSRVYGAIDDRGFVSGQRSTTVRLREIARAVAAENLDRLDGLDRRDQADDRAQDAGHVAGGRAAGRGALGHEAAEAGRFAGQDGHRLPFGPHAAAVDPRQAELHRRVVDQRTASRNCRSRRESRRCLRRTVRCCPGRCRPRPARSTTAELIARSFSAAATAFGSAGRGVGLVEERLPLKVRQSRRNRDRRCAACRRRPGPAMLAMALPNAPQPHSSAPPAPAAADPPRPAGRKRDLAGVAGKIASKVWKSDDTTEFRGFCFSLGFLSPILTHHE